MTGILFCPVSIQHLSGFDTDPYTFFLIKQKMEEIKLAVCRAPDFLKIAAGPWYTLKQYSKTGMKKGHARLTLTKNLQFFEPGITV